MNMMDIHEQIIAKTLRIPCQGARDGTGQAATRRLDVALMKVGFKLDNEAFATLSGRNYLLVENTGRLVLRAVKSLVGVKAHNPYFENFPDGIPDTLDFWLKCAAETVEFGGNPCNLLDCPSYGTPQHTYDDMLEAHEKFISSLRGRVTLLTMGGTLSQEAERMYLSLAESQIPLNAVERVMLTILMENCVNSEQPEKIPVRENRALINAVRVELGKFLLIDTYTDILRLACGMSDGDVTLEKVTKFKSFKRSERRILLKAINKVSSHKMSDLMPYRERWKRLLKALHPGDYPKYQYAQEVAEVIYRGVKMRSPMALFEIYMQRGELIQAMGDLKPFPGYFFRQLDRIMRACNNPQVLEYFFATVKQIAPKVSLRVLLAVREHLLNRNNDLNGPRIYVNHKGRSWVSRKEMLPVSHLTLHTVMSILDVVIDNKIPETNIDPTKSHHDLVLSDKTLPEGLEIVPRGTCEKVSDMEVLRMFAYWKQSRVTTDYDLSTLMFDRNFEYTGHVSWTTYKLGSGVNEYAKYSGDITEAPDGATEFIDLYLDKVPENIHFIIPQLYIYDGESFDVAEEVFMGYMSRDLDQMGKPFEPTTVRTKSDLTSDSKVACPFVLCRCADGWEIKWAHLYVKGRNRMNTCEGNKATSAMIMKAIIEKEYLTAQYLINTCETITCDSDEPTVDVKDIFKG